MIMINKKQYLIDSVENFIPLSIMDIISAKQFNINQRNFARYRAELSLRLLKKIS